jgi:hypothetical protein
VRAGGDVPGIRPLPMRDRLLHPAQPPGGVGQGVEVGRVGVGRVDEPAQQRVGQRPVAAHGRLPCSFR